MPMTMCGLVGRQARAIDEQARHRLALGVAAPRGRRGRRGSGDRRRRRRGAPRRAARARGRPRARRAPRRRLGRRRRRPRGRASAGWWPARPEYRYRRPASPDNRFIMARGDPSRCLARRLVPVQDAIGSAAGVPGRQGRGQRPGHRQAAPRGQGRRSPDHLAARRTAPAGPGEGASPTSTSRRPRRASSTRTSRRRRRPRSRPSRDILRAGRMAMAPSVPDKRERRERRRIRGLD